MGTMEKSEIDSLKEEASDPSFLSDQIQKLIKAQLSVMVKDKEQKLKEEQEMLITQYKNECETLQDTVSSLQSRLIQSETSLETLKEEHNKVLAKHKQLREALIYFVRHLNKIIVSVSQNNGGEKSETSNQKLAELSAHVNEKLQMMGINRKDLQEEVRKYAKIVSSLVQNLNVPTSTSDRNQNKRLSKIEIGNKKKKLNSVKPCANGNQTSRKIRKLPRGICCRSCSKILPSWRKLLEHKRIVHVIKKSRTFLQRKMSLRIKIVRAPGSSTWNVVPPSILVTDDNQCSSDSEENSAVGDDAGGCNKETVPINVENLQKSQLIISEISKKETSASISNQVLPINENLASNNNKDILPVIRDNTGDTEKQTPIPIRNGQTRQPIKPKISISRLGTSTTTTSNQVLSSNTNASSRNHKKDAPAAIRDDDAGNTEEPTPINVGNEQNRQSTVPEISNQATSTATSSPVVSFHEKASSNNQTEEAQGTIITVIRDDADNIENPLSINVASGQEQQPTVPEISNPNTSGATSIQVLSFLANPSSNDHEEDEPRTIPAGLPDERLTRSKITHKPPPIQTNSVNLANKTNVRKRKFMESEIPMATSYPFPIPTGCEKKFECNVCLQSFLFLWELQSHQKHTHKITNLRTEGMEGCPLCGKELPSMEELLRHHQNRHANRRCHQESQQTPPVNPAPSSSSSSAAAAAFTPDNTSPKPIVSSVPTPTVYCSSKNHAFNKSSDPLNPFICKCGLKFGNKDTINAHVRYFTLSKTFPCSYGDCEQLFSNLLASNKHARQVHKVEPDPNYLACTSCGVVFANGMEYRRHLVMITSNQSRSCPITILTERKKTTPAEPSPVERSTDDTSETNPHVAVAGCSTSSPDPDLKFVCRVCDKRFPFAYSLSNHMKTAHKIFQSLGVGCRECGEFFPNNMDLFDHQRMQHGFGPPSEVEYKYTPPTPLPTTEATPSLTPEATPSTTTEATPSPTTDATPSTTSETTPTTTPAQVEVHRPLPVDRQSKEKYKFDCACGQVFTSSSHRQTHIRIKTQGKIFICPWCPQRFSTHGNLKAHVRRRHPANVNQLSKFACATCAQTFDEQAELTQHRANTHSK